MRPLVGGVKRNRIKGWVVMVKCRHVTGEHNKLDVDADGRWVRAGLLWETCHNSEPIPERKT